MRSYLVTMVREGEPWATVIRHESKVQAAFAAGVLYATDHPDVSLADDMYKFAIRESRQSK